MAMRTDSYTAVLNDDGTTTTTEVITFTPPTKAQQTAAAIAVAGLLAMPFIPLVAIVTKDKYIEIRDKRREKKTQLKIV